MGYDYSECFIFYNNYGGNDSLSENDIVDDNGLK